MLNAFKNNGWECGADWANGKKEYPHVQKTFGINWKELNSRRLAR
jgi:hypothetical protein